MHAVEAADRVSRMAHLATFEIEPSKPVLMEPGSMHLMLLGLRAMPTTCSEFPLTLEFEEAGEVPVLGAGASGPASGGNDE